MSFAKITGTGSYAPEKVLTNYDFEKIVDTSDEWIRTRTGIRERRIADPDVATSDMAYEASVKALEAASIDPSDIDGIILGTVTPDYLFPASSCLVQHRLEAKNAFAFDLSAGCSGFIYALQAAKAIIVSGDAENILVIGAETLSRIVDYRDRSTCILFGDGAGAAVLSKSDENGILSTYLRANGEEWDKIIQPAGGSRIPSTEESVRKGLHYLKMKGNDVFKEGVKGLEYASLEAIKKADVTTEQIALFIPHQANHRIMEAARKRLNLPPEKLFVNVDRYGNTSSASVAIALDEVVRNGRIKKDDLILFAVIGSGFTLASAVVRW
ncbi:ketoacyl-ACP synthase III [Desulfobacterota bacterium AH_259_B03_O07]|nr:ketoacyl-ACP synthase III [Desulfobacterota bacterium AH_259_B03_O07]